MKRKSLLVAMASVSLAAIGIGATSTMAWFQATASAGLANPTGNFTAIGVTDPEVQQSELDSMTVTINYTRVDKDGGTYASPKNLKLVEYGQHKAASGADYDVIEVKATGTNEWHYAIKSAGGTLLWDSDADNGTSFTGSNYDNFAIYKVTATVASDAEKRAGFATAHPNGMESEISFTVLDDKTGYWTKATAPGAYDAAPESTQTLTIEVEPSDLDEDSEVLLVGYLMVYAHGSEVTSTADNIGVTPSYEAFSDIAASQGI